MNVQKIRLSDIVVPDNRIRREFDPKAIDELADSIWRLGLLQPIKLRDDGKTLIAGERRIRAHLLILEKKEEFLEKYDGVLNDYVIDLIDNGHIAYVLHHELSTQELIEAELEENVVRRDIPWQDQIRARAALHALRTEQHGPGGQGKKEGWSVSDTAKEIFGESPTGSDREAVSNSLFLDKFLDNPLVAAADSEKEAMKVVRNLEAEQRRAQKAKAFDPATADFVCLQGSCYDILQHKDYAERFDGIIADPPYGRDVHKHSFADRHGYDDSREQFIRFCKEFPSLARSVCKPQAHFYIFHDIRDFEKLMIECEVAGWKVWPWPLIWDKGNVGTFGAAKYGPRHCYDAILYANKGEKECIMMQPDILSHSGDHTLLHPAGKPIPLYEDLMRRSFEPGDEVLDPMCGGGTIFPAARRQKLVAVGIEELEKYYHMSLEMAMEGK